MPEPGGPTLEEVDAMVKAATAKGARVRERKSALGAMLEKDLQAAVLKAAAFAGWLAYHTFRSDKSTPGYPDLCLVHDHHRRLLFAELKREKGKLTDPQVRWLNMLSRIHGVEVYVWRPSDLIAIPHILKSRVRPVCEASAWTPTHEASESRRWMGQEGRP